MAIPMCRETWMPGMRFCGKRKIQKPFVSGAKGPGGLHSPDQLAEAMFALSRLRNENGPLQAYLYLSELDHRRPPERKLSPQTVVLLAEKYPDFSNQYLIFSEFPELTDVSLTHFLTTAEAAK